MGRLDAAGDYKMDIHDKEHQRAALELRIKYFESLDQQAELQRLRALRDDLEKFS